MTKRSRFLTVPVEPFVVERGLCVDEVLARMARVSFQGRNLATALGAWQRMLDDEVTIFMGLAGALSAGGMRLVVAHLITHRCIDCLVSTGANLYHDLHETLGQIVTDVPHDGGASRSTLEEAKSWGTLASDADQVTVHPDATIALPMLPRALATVAAERISARRPRQFDLTGRTLTIDGVPLSLDRFQEPE